MKKIWEKRSKVSPDKKELWWAATFVVILAFSIIGLLILSNATNPHVSIPEKPINVSLVIKGEGWAIEYNALTKNNTAFSLLIEASQELNFTVDYTKYKIFDSVLVEGINGSKNGKGGLWWQYWVNGNYGEVGSDNKEIKDGDVVEWRFAPYA